jgi:hypothetical protein
MAATALLVAPIDASAPFKRSDGAAVGDGHGCAEQQQCA